MPNSPATMTALCLTASLLCAADAPTFTVGERETLATPAQRQTLGLKWFPDGNLGIVQTTGQRVQFYGANGASSVRVTGTPQAPLQKVESVTIATTNTHFRYLAGGPTYRDPDSQRLFLFYHAEIHRGTSQNFYSVIGLSVQTDADGLAFQDLGPVFTPNVPNVDAPSIVEICGAPYIIRDGHFHIYARDVMSDGHPRESNLSVARASVAEVIQAGLAGHPATWTKWNGTAFSEPATGGRSAPLETGNPGTRWMDITYNTALQKYVMVVAADTSPQTVELFVTSSADGITWAERKKLVTESGESFYPSIIGFEDDPRQTGAAFYIYYTFSEQGGWNRWDDAAIVRRKITVAAE